MASAAAQIFIDYMKQNGVNCGFVDAEETIINIGWKLDKTRITNYIIFDENDTYVQIRGSEFITIPQDNFEDILHEVNELNKEYRWVRFYLDQEAGEVKVISDAIIQLDTCAEEVEEIMLRMHHIVDDIYPRLMKILWS